jgi:glycerol-3-phosphate acyltransferase PlsY
MKILVISTVSLLIGLLIGGIIVGYIEVKYWHRKMEEAHSWQSEDFHRVEAVDAVNYVQLLDAGKTLQAVQMMARPITFYYYLDAGDTNAFRNTFLDRMARTNIEQLASTDQIVAAFMATEKAYLHGK